MEVVNLEPMYSVEQLVLFVKDFSGVNDNETQPESDIFAELGVSGDDSHELIEKYSKEYSVDMTDYLWYFHTDEEGGNHNIGSSFFKPPYQQVQRIPVTPILLTEFANSGKWQIDYPEHTIPRRRYDIIINQIVVIAFLLFLIFKYFID